MMGQENESGKRKIGGPKCSGNGYKEESLSSVVARIIEHQT
jgi:hypothetical protein